MLLKFSVFIMLDLTHGLLNQLHDIMSYGQKSLVTKSDFKNALHTSNK